MKHQIHSQDTFQIKFLIHQDQKTKKGDYWLIDETICESQTILGCGDIDWHRWSAHFPGLTYGGVNTYDMMTSSVDFGTYADITMMAEPCICIL